MSGPPDKRRRWEQSQPHWYAGGDNRRQRQSLGRGRWNQAQRQSQSGQWSYPPARSFDNQGRNSQFLNPPSLGNSHGASQYHAQGALGSVPRKPRTAPPEQAFPAPSLMNTLPQPRNDQNNDADQSRTKDAVHAQLSREERIIKVKAAVEGDRKRMNEVLDDECALKFDPVDYLPHYNYEPQYYEGQPKYNELIEAAVGKVEAAIATRYQSTKDASSDEDLGIEPGFDPDEGDGWGSILDDKSDASAPLVYFVRQLPYCVSLNFGFHTIYDEEKCYCPCSKKLNRWQNNFLIGLDEADKCTADGQLAPQSLWQHLDNKSESSKYHWAVKVYIEAVYVDYLKIGLDHPGMYFKQSLMYRRAETFVKSQQFSYSAAIGKQLQEERKARAQLEKDKVALEQLKLVDEEKAAELESMKLLLQKLNKRFKLDPIVKRHLSDSEVEELNMKKKSCFSLFEKQLHQCNDSFDLYVDNNFKLQEKFDVWREDSQCNFLFRELDSELASKWFGLGWNIHYSADLKVSQNKARKYKMLAKDEGGPTREFLTEVWQQMGGLIAVCGSQNGLPIKVSLFEDDMCKNLQFVSDEKIMASTSRDTTGKARDTIHEIFPPLYRALGRIMLYCLTQGIAMAPHVLPNLYRRYLLCGMDPTNPEYPIERLVDDMVAILPSLGSKSGSTDLEVEKVENVVGQYFEWIVDDAQNGEDQSFSTFRQNIKERYVDGYQIALQGLKDGLSLDGNLNATWMNCVFASMPFDGLCQLLYCKVKVEAQEVISCLRVEHHSGNIEHQGLIICEDVNGVSGALPDLIREKSKSEPDYLARFVRFVTGYQYVPVLHNGTPFEIIVEFNQDESSDWDSLPQVHSCVNTIKFPGSAYGGNKDILEEKLTKAMQCYEIVKFDSV